MAGAVLLFWIWMCNNANREQWGSGASDSALGGLLPWAVVYILAL